MNGTVIAKDCEINRIQKNEMKDKQGNIIPWYECRFYQGQGIHDGGILTIHKDIADHKFEGQKFDMVIQVSEDQRNNRIQKMKIIDFLKDGKSVKAPVTNK